ncbi:[NiFe]-hydrogenase assembly chaperone HybE [Amphritea pacifica]|uniref:[NiFe]-hydrogenase assembly chaperone HybE n=1 Tax=Amphritea pacifica TaxID=2811233 RepID=A0ABS2W2S5_9GAMM|nr:[NiFe]-hydrogenase assembly chaperone HybE [Amphritea pacifica]MBN0986013.1 [NiFe]-hydrogenase assembly chaperone HybE [Amphritea pacifica]
MVDIGLIESRYVEILHTRMEGVAVVNQKLQVKTLGFQSLENEQLGVLVTPWFMNLMLLPETDQQWTEREAGSKTVRHLPSGPYEFILGWDEVLGGYGMCALFSPMFEFRDQSAAVATAEEVIKALFEPDNFAPTDRQRQLSVSDPLMKTAEATDTTRVADASQAPIDEDEAIRLSRRQFLTGGCNTTGRYSGYG